MNTHQLTANTRNSSPRQLAVVAGYGLLLMTVAIMVGELLLLQNIIVDGDAATTANNIVANQSQFRWGIVCYLIVILCDLVVAWALYLYLKPLHPALSLLAAWSRLVYTIFFGIALVNYYSVFQLLGGAEFLAVFEPSQLHAQVMLLLAAFRDMWGFGYIFFGLHLALLGTIILKSDAIPKLLGVVLLLAGVSYLIDYIGHILLPNFDSAAVSLIFGWGELIFMVWLLFRGGKAQSRPVAKAIA